MTTSIANHNDHLIQLDVAEELAWAPQVKDAQIGVSVLDGVVTLSGEVDTYTSSVDAKNAALRVSGVTVVANELKVRNSTEFKRTDIDIAASIKHVLDWSADLPQGAVQAEVRNHVVILTGVVPWDYQRRAAARVIRGLVGVLQIENRIELSPKVSASNTSKLIKSALVRHALVDANAITVITVGSAVTLTGQVSTWEEKDQAGHAAWSSPHIGVVHNKIEVRP